MNARNFIALGLLLLIAACRPLELERPGVPIIWGMRLDEPPAAAELGPNMAKLRDLRMRELAIELPLVADSIGLPMVPPLPLEQVAALSRNFKVRLHIVFATIHPRELFPGDSMPAPAPWFASLERQIDSTLAVLAPAEPARIVIGSNLEPAELHADAWRNLLDHLQERHGCLVSYGCYADRIADLSFLDACSEIAVDLPPAPISEAKAQARQLNQEVGQLALKLDKPVLVFRVNAMGKVPEEAFLNALRFWPEATQLNGIVLNTIYGRIPMRDETSYYGLADDEAFSEALKSYRQRNK